MHSFSLLSVPATPSKHRITPSTTAVYRIGDTVLALMHRAESQHKISVANVELSVHKSDELPCLVTDSVNVQVRYESIATCSRGLNVT